MYKFTTLETIIAFAMIILSNFLFIKWIFHIDAEMLEKEEKLAREEGLRNE